MLRLSVSFLPSRERAATVAWVETSLTQSTPPVARSPLGSVTDSERGVQMASVPDGASILSSPVALTVRRFSIISFHRAAFRPTSLKSTSGETGATPGGRE